MWSAQRILRMPMRTMRIYVLLLFALGGAYAIPETIDLSAGWRFAPDPQDQGLGNRWFAPDFDDQGWAVLEAGKRWEDQGYPDLDGLAWYRKWVEIPAGGQQGPVWLVLGGVNDEFVLFCNGERVNSFGSPPDHSVAEAPCLAEISRFLRSGTKNLIALRILDWGGKGGIQRLPCRLTSDPAEVPSVPTLSLACDYETGDLLAECDLLSLGLERPGIQIRFRVDSIERNLRLAEVTVPAKPGELSVKAVFGLPAPERLETWRVWAEIQGMDPPFPHSCSSDIAMGRTPSWPGHPELEILNNFVTQLAAAELPGSQSKEITLVNPREGWVLLSLRSALTEQRGLQGRVILQGREKSLILREDPHSGWLESMLFLPVGAHALTVSTDTPAHLEIRAVPELSYTYYPCTTNLKVHGPFDWTYLERYVLPHVNTLVTAGGASGEVLQAWSDEGRRWIVNTSLPGLSGPPPVPGEVAQSWRSVRGLDDPRTQGLIVDEFIGASPAHYQAWREAMELLYTDPVFIGKTFYAFSGDIYRAGDPESRAFCRSLLDRGGLFAVEKYLPEEPTLDTAKSWLLNTFQSTLRDWQAIYPGFEKRLVYCMGTLSAPPESLNTHPGVDLRVYMDMQFHLLANDPTFWGLLGVMQYTASYADEEILRWTQRLFRHYCLEGKRTRLTDDPYHLPHLVNSDFTDGLSGWEVSPAESESVRTGEMEGFSWLQGRYPRTLQGDAFAVLRRSPDRPSFITQTIRNLQPGRSYSVKLLSADIAHLDQRQEIAVGIQIADVERVSDLSFRTVYPSCYSHTLGAYNREHPAYFTYDRLVFRPRSSEATLSISDWVSPESPGGPAGQEIAVNFVEVQPFLEP